MSLSNYTQENYTLSNYKNCKAGGGCERGLYSVRRSCKLAYGVSAAVVELYRDTRRAQGATSS